MNSKSKLCVIVDSYSTGKFLSLEFQKYDINCVHVQSTKNIPLFFKSSFYLDNFIDNIIHKGDIDQTLLKLSQFNIAFVIPGCELGVELADNLSEKLGLSSNGTEYSKARRNKFEMGETLRDFGVRTVNQIKSANLEEILSWVKQRDEYPVVLKPISSAATHNVVFCNNENDVIYAFERIINRKNILETINSEVLVQEFLSGTEYIVNTVSLEGQHHICDIWRYQKREMPGHGTIYDFNEALPSNGKVQEELSRYIKQVLDALRIQFGACHSEVMMTKTGPVLVETNARLSGGMIPEVISKAMQTNQVELMVKSYVDPDSFRNLIGKPYTLQKNIWLVLLISEVEGKIRSISQINEIKNLPSFGDLYLPLKKGDTIKKTVDLLSCPGYIFLVHENSEIIQQDYQTIRKLEKNGLYDVNVITTVNV